MRLDERIALAAADKQFYDCVADQVIECHDGRIEFHFTDHSGFCTDNESQAPAPKVGDTIRLFGRGFGWRVRGCALVRGGEIVALYLYRTQAEDGDEHAAEVERSRARKRSEWEDKKSETVARIAALPKPFQERIEFFMRNQDWGWEYGPYELFCCEEAVKIAIAIGLPEAIAAFAKCDIAEQKLVAPSLAYHEHSGNTFAAACKFAYAFAEDPQQVARMHGALCPLVGCDSYGCYAVTAEAARLREESR